MWRTYLLICRYLFKFIFRLILLWTARDSSFIVFTLLHCYTTPIKHCRIYKETQIFGYLYQQIVLKRRVLIIAARLLFTLQILNSPFLSLHQSMLLQPASSISVHNLFDNFLYPFAESDRWVHEEDRVHFQTEREGICPCIIFFSVRKYENMEIQMSTRRPGAVTRCHRVERKCILIITSILPCKMRLPCSYRQSNTCFYAINSIISTPLPFSSFRSCCKYEGLPATCKWDSQL